MEKLRESKFHAQPIIFLKKFAEAIQACKMCDGIEKALAVFFSKINSDPELSDVIRLLLHYFLIGANSVGENADNSGD